MAVKEPVGWTVSLILEQVRPQANRVRGRCLLVYTDLQPMVSRGIEACEVTPPVFRLQSLSNAPFIRPRGFKTTQGHRANWSTGLGQPLTTDRIIVSRQKVSLDSETFRSLQIVADLVD